MRPRVWPTVRLPACRPVGRTGASRRDEGVTVVETAVALFLTLFLSVLLMKLAAGVRRGGEETIRRTEVAEARRVARDLLQETLAGAVAPLPPGPGASARFWVGWAVPCGGGVWAYRGRRRPAPERDSLWVVDAGGESRILGLAASAGGACSLSGEAAVVLEGEAAGLLDRAAMVRVFESGRVTLSDAFRYGRVGTAPQPLTATVLDPGASSLVTTDTGVEASLASRGESTPTRWRWRLP